jgi:NAD(P)-dependent dehydrogenase (short-subunit alcohol dehydrogenase family)
VVLTLSACPLVQQQVGSHMIKRMGTVRDVALCCVFLASDESTFITAAPIMVDGGFVAQ